MGLGFRVKEEGLEGAYCLRQQGERSRDSGTSVLKELKGQYLRQLVILGCSACCGKLRLKWPSKEGFSKMWGPGVHGSRSMPRVQLPRKNQLRI